MANLWRVAINSHHSSGVEFANVLHYKARPHSVISDDATAAEVADAVTATLMTAYRACFTTAVTVDDVVATEVLAPGSTDVPEQGAHAVALTGSRGLAGDQLPVASCPLIAFYTNAAIRSGHGRIFLPMSGPASDLDSAGKYDSGSTFWTTTLPALVTALGTKPRVTSGGTVDQDLYLVVYSRKRHAEPGPPDYYFDVTGITPRQQLHWLRSRTTAP